MNKSKNLIFIIITIFAFKMSFSQLTFERDTVCAGDTVNVEFLSSVLEDNFNNMSLDPLIWTSANANPSFLNPCGQGPNGAYLWVGATASNERTIKTFGLDFTSNTCYVKWFMKYGDVSGSGSCEDPDQANEGVHLQYSTDNGITWTDFPGIDNYPIGTNSTVAPFNTSTYGSGGFWTPIGVPPSPPTNTAYYWHEYKSNVPVSAISSSTNIRWAQLAASSTGYDTWGIDEVEISCEKDSFSIFKPNGNLLVNPDYLIFPNKLNDYDTCVISKAKNVLGNTIYDTVCLHILNGVNSDFSVPASPVCTSDDVVLNPLAAQDNSYNYLWNINNSVNNNYGPLNLNVDTGYYDISFTVDNGYCQSKTNKNFYVNQSPVVQFSVDNNSGCEPLEVNLTNNSVFADDYLWDFDDGFTSVLENPTHYFPGGLHDVKLVAHNSLCSDSAVYSNLINAFDAPDSVLAKHYDTLIAPVADTYQWYDCGTGQIIPGATNSIYVPQIDGYYKVVMTLGNCTTITDCYHVVIGGLNNSEDIGITLKPNPTKGQFNLIIEKYKNIEFVEIYNSQMQLIKKIKISKESSIIDLSDYAAGNYNILIINDKSKVVDNRRVIKI